MNPRQRDAIISLDRSDDFNQFIDLVSEIRTQELDSLTTLQPDPYLIGIRQGYVQALDMILRLNEEAINARNNARGDR